MSIGLDYETKCDLDLKTVGIDRYVNHPSFRVLLAGVYAAGNEICYDFVCDSTAMSAFLALLRRQGRLTICVFNADFERAVTKKLFSEAKPDWFRDAAMMAREYGLSNKLEAVAQQLLGVGKIPEGKDLIKKFCGPDPLPDSGYLNTRSADWHNFRQYVTRDARLAYEVVEKLDHHVSSKEYAYETITHSMNARGWSVDHESLLLMKDRYEENLKLLKQEFQHKHDPQGELNFNSHVQLKAWCKARGINITSTDEQHIERYVRQLTIRLDKMKKSHPKYMQYLAVLEMLQTKQELGGSSLKKLQKILDLAGVDGNLRYQYLHAGASQTLRTSGRGVQMQNLKRFSGAPKDMAELKDPSVHWTNEELAENIRQLFTSSKPNGQLIVGDFSSVEARALAYLAGQDDVVGAFRQGKDLYKVQASKMFGVPYERVTKAQRLPGKVAVLSCGYQAGSNAVQGFASKMGVAMSETEASKLVTDWRASNREIVKLWSTLDHALHQAMRGNSRAIVLGGDFSLRIDSFPAPESLQQIHAGVRSLRMAVYRPNGAVFLTRWFHGAHYRQGQTVVYYKPTIRKDGTLWTHTHQDPKTKRYELNTIYGGKLTGILVQSFCREIFFEILSSVYNYVLLQPDIDLVGQFHDEIIVDSYGPLDKHHEQAAAIRGLMSRWGSATDFPLTAEVNSDYRYIK